MSVETLLKEHNIVGEAGVQFVNQFDAVLLEAKQKLEADNEKIINEGVESRTSEIQGYIDYAVDAWLQENKPLVESKIKVKNAEKIIDGLRELFAENSLKLDDEATTILESSEDKLKKVKDDNAILIEKNIELTNKLKLTKRENIVTEATQDLSANQAEKIKVLSESVKFVDEETFKSDVAVLVDTFKVDSTKTETPQAPKPVLSEQTAIQKLLKV